MSMLVVRSRTNRIIGTFDDPVLAKKAEDAWNVYIGEKMVEFNGAFTEEYPLNKFTPETSRELVRFCGSFSDTDLKDII